MTIKVCSISMLFFITLISFSCTFDLTKEQKKVLDNFKVGDTISFSLSKDSIKERVIVLEKNTYLTDINPLFSKRYFYNTKNGYVKCINISNDREFDIIHFYNHSYSFINKTNNYSTKVQLKIGKDWFINNSFNSIGVSNKKIDSTKSHFVFENDNGQKLFWNDHVIFYLDSRKRIWKAQLAPD